MTLHTMSVIRFAQQARPLANALSTSPFNQGASSDIPKLSVLSGFQKRFSCLRISSNAKKRLGRRCQASSSSVIRAMEQNFRSSSVTGQGFNCYFSTKPIVEATLLRSGVGEPEILNVCGRGKLRYSSKE